MYVRIYDRDIVDASRGRPNVAGGDHLIDNCFWPGKQGLNGTVRAVTNPAIDVEAFGLLDCPAAKPNTLHPTGNANANYDADRVFGHCL